MRRLLRVPEGPPSADDASAHRIFSASILLSGLRCLLGYVVLPILTPMLGAAAGAGPAVGLPIGIVALRFDVRGVRRFWLASHRWRWPITAFRDPVPARLCRDPDPHADARSGSRRRAGSTT